MNITPQGHVNTTINGGIATISFFHPAHNSLPANLLTALTEQITAAGNDPSVLVVILKSEGDRTFCAGASFDELKAVQDTVSGTQFFLGFANVINAMRKCPKFIIGRIHGKAVGGGVGLAAAADYCLATVNATIKLSELAIGIGPFVIGPAVERKLGLSAFSQMAINATEWCTAEWAKDKGLFTEVFESTERLDAYIAFFAEKLVHSSPEAMRQLKAVLWEGTEHWETLLYERAAMSGNLILSDFAKAAIAK